jgi:hypothetical protein
LVYGFRDIQGFWHLTYEPLPWFDPQVQLQLLIDAVNAFVVPTVTLNIPEEQIAQAKALGPVVIGQSD